jgi:hypothetical protein
MKAVTPICVHWSADDAHLVISFLDELCDQLWAVYGDEIIAHQQELADLNARQTELAFDDQIKF